MLRKVVVLLVMVCMCFEYAYAESDYPYKSVCPPNAGYNSDGATRSATMQGGPINGGWWNPSEYDQNGVLIKDRNYWVDKWSFAQCNCTSYVAYKLNDPFGIGETDDIYGIPFKNNYLQPSGKAWSHGGRWGDAARRANIAVDKRPLPGDAVYFTGGSYGHIAYVEHVDYDSDMNWERIYISEYNFPSPGTYGTREITPSSTGFPNKPAGFIHLRAVINPEFYFNYYDLGYDFAGQTKEEWEYIFALVMRNYYDANRDPKYASAFNQVWNSIGGILPIGFGGGGSSGPGYDDDTDGDNWAGYAHHVGLKYMKIGKKSSGHWHGSRTWTAGEIPSKRDFRVKLKRKGGVWVDEACAEVWFSHNENFTSSDLYLKKKCKDLSDETEDERSIYIKDVHLPDMEAGKNYYFFTRVTYSGGVNPSSDDDSDEYVKVEVVENPNNSNNQPGSSVGIVLSPEEIMSILFN